MPPQGQPPDLHQTVHQAAQRMGLDPQATPLPVNQALASEPLRALSQEINAAHAADRPEVLDRAVEAFQAVDLAYRSAVALLRTGFQMFGRDVPDWLRTQDDFVTNQAPGFQPGAAQFTPVADRTHDRVQAQFTAPPSGVAQPGTAPAPAQPSAQPGQSGTAQPAPQPGTAGQPQGAAAPAPPTQPGQQGPNR